MCKLLKSIHHFISLYFTDHSRIYPHTVSLHSQCKLTVPKLSYLLKVGLQITKSHQKCYFQYTSGNLICLPASCIVWYFSITATFHPLHTHYSQFLIYSNKGKLYNLVTIYLSLFIIHLLDIYCQTSYNIHVSFMPDPRETM